MDRKNTGFKTEVKCRRGAVRSRPGGTLVDKKSSHNLGEILMNNNSCPSREGKPLSLHHKNPVTRSYNHWKKALARGSKKFWVNVDNFNLYKIKHHF